jgi:DNA-binding response OmpR family regulator
MSQTVLIVDDSAPLHELIKVHLDEQALQVHSAYDGDAGLFLASTLKPDLVLLDVDMPKMNGFEVCRLLKADNATAGIPIIFLTAACSTDAKVCGFELRAVDYVTKPFDPSELCARVRVALRTKRLLDLLPEPIVGPHTTGSGAGSRYLNARISLAHLMQSRSENPWNRRRLHDSGDGTKPAQPTARQGS